MKKFKETIVLICLVMTMTGCYQSKIDNQIDNIEGNSETTANVTQDIENAKQEQSKEEVGETKEYSEEQIRMQMIQGLSTLEIVKIKSAFLGMMDSIERGKHFGFSQTIQDLQSVINIVEYEPFKQDLIAVQKLIQYVVDRIIEQNGAVYYQTTQSEKYLEDERYAKYLEYVLKMLNDLTLFGVDYPFPKDFVRPVYSSPQIIGQEIMFEVTRTFGDEYPEYIQEVVDTTEVSVEDVYDLRADMKDKQDLINEQIRDISPEDLEVLKAKTLEAGNLIYEIRKTLNEQGFEVTMFRELVKNELPKLEEIVLECSSYLQEGSFKTEYLRLLEYFQYILEESPKEGFDADTMLISLETTKQTLDDICVAILGDVEPKVNKGYAGVTAVLEYSPVTYDWLRYEMTGEYPKDALPETNFFGKPITMIE